MRYKAAVLVHTNLTFSPIPEKVTLLGDTLMEAVGVWLESNKAPGRKVRYREYTFPT